MKIEAISQAMPDAPSAHPDLPQVLRVLWRRVLGLTRRAPKRLRLCESLPLGDRRFVAVVEYENVRFLVGGTSASLVLLSRLGERSDGQSGEYPPRTETQGEEL